MTTTTNKTTFFEQVLSGNEQTFFNLFEPFDVKERPSWLLAAAKQDEVEISPHGSLFQIGVLMDCQETPGMAAVIAATQTGKSISALIEAIIMASGQVPVCMRYAKGVDTGVPRIVNEENIARFGLNAQGNCGNIIGVGIYPKEKIPPAGNQIWICTYKEAKDKMWRKKFAKIIPPYFLDTTIGTNGFSESKQTYFFTNGNTISFITYEQDYHRVEAEKAWLIILDEEPPDRRFYISAVEHCRYLRSYFTPINGLCFDEATEILTNHGWRSINTVNLGDKIATWKNGKISFTECDKIYQKQAVGTMKRIKGRTFDALVTENHRWPVTYNTRIDECKLVETKNLKSSQRIPVNGEFQEWIENKKYPDAFVSLMGWMLSDGTINKGKRSITIYQSKTRYPDKCDEIDKLCRELNLRVRKTERQYDYQDGTKGIAVRWDCYSHNEIVKNRDSQRSRRVGEVFDDLDYVMQMRKLSKNPPTEWLFSLTKRQARLLFDAMNRGDGTLVRKDIWRYTQINDDASEFYKTLAFLLGYSIADYWDYTEKGKKVHKIMTAHRTTKAVSNLSITNEYYSGKIWCVSTRAGTLIAKRNGTIYVSGNSWMYHEIYLPIIRGENRHCKLYTCSQYDSPYHNREKVEMKRSKYKPYEIKARVWGQFSDMAGKPYYTFDITQKLLRLYVPRYTLAKIMPPQRPETVRDALKLKMVFEPASETKDDTWEIYEQYSEDDTYWLAADIAEGNENPDASQDGSAAYIRRLPREGEKDPQMVSALYSRLRNVEFSWLCLYAAIYYNYCLMAPEARGEDAAVFLTTIINYPFIYKHVVTSDKTHRLKEMEGFDTTVGNRKLIFDMAGTWIYDRADNPRIYHYRLLKEFSECIVGKNGRPDHGDQGSTDCLLAFGISQYVFQFARNQIRNNRNQRFALTKEPAASTFPNLLGRRMVKETRKILGTARGLDQRAQLDKRYTSVSR